MVSTWPFTKSPDALHLLVLILAQKRPETFQIAKYWYSEMERKNRGKQGPTEGARESLTVED